MSKQLSYFNIDQNSPIPLYYQIQQNIIELIEANVIRAGDPCLRNENSATCTRLIG